MESIQANQLNCSNTILSFEQFEIERIKKRIERLKEIKAQKEQELLTLNKQEQ